jgi:hypothetical protein
MKMELLWRRTCAVLVAILVAQVGWLLVNSTQPRPNAWASWEEAPESLEEVVASADDMVLAQVVRIRSSELVSDLADHPAGEDRIPVSVVTLRVENRYDGRGGRPEMVEVFHTGLGEPERRGGPPEAPPAGAQRPRDPWNPGEFEGRRILLDDDPPYERGERYLLMLKSGPELPVDGSRIRTMRLVSPEGRYRIRSDGSVEPVSQRAAFARELRGRRLEDVEQRVRAAADNRRPPR